MGTDRIVSHKDLEQFAFDLFVAGGYTKDEAELTSKSLILSNLMGHDSHGLVRVKEYNDCLLDGSAVSGVDLKILHESPASCHADGLTALGQVQMPRLLDKLFAKIETQAVVTGSIVNCGHLGRLGEWVDEAAKRGYAAFMGVNDNGALQLVAPAGAKEGRTSTNPVAFAIPLKDGKSFSIDMSTSATAMGKVRLAHLNKQSIPEGLIQDVDGKPTTDPSTLFADPAGTVLPFGGYKGFALSMIVDCLVAGLSGGFTPPAPNGSLLVNNTVICLWNPRYFAGLEHMQFEAEKYVAHVRTAMPSDPAKPVRAPGDRAKSIYVERVKNGVPLNENFCEMMRGYAQKLGVKVPASIAD